MQSTREVNIVPKKANWDLKRDVEKRLEKLNKETQKAIAALISASETPLLPCSVPIFPSPSPPLFLQRSD